MCKPCFVILDIKCPRAVEIDAGAGSRPANGYELERGHLSRFATHQRIIHGFGDKGTNTEATGFSCATNPLRKQVI